MPRACVLQHIRCEPPGLFTGLLEDRGFVTETVELDEAFAAARDSMARTAAQIFTAWLDLAARHRPGGE